MNRLLVADLQRRIAQWQQEKRERDRQRQGQEFSFEVITVNARGEVVARRPGTARSLQQDLGNGVFVDLVFIPGGTFLMGSPDTEKERYDGEGPQHEVAISPFLMGKYPVTQAQWQAGAVLPQIERELDPDPSRFKGAQRPVEQVSWEEAGEYCRRLSQSTGDSYRLPTEAEWEYACRAGTTTPFYFGETISPDLANYDGDFTYGAGPKGIYRAQTTDVGSFPPNAFGLYDMHGNVWEWCEDIYAQDAYSQHQRLDPIYAGAGSDRVLRGGSWDNFPRYVRCAYRYSRTPQYRDDGVGFRLARTC